MRYICLLITILLTFTVYGQDIVERHQLDKKNIKLFDKALNAIKKKEDDQAVKCLNKILAKYPGFNEARLKLASLHLKTKQNDQALFHLEKLMANSKIPDPKIVLTLAQLYENSDDYQKAISLIEMFLNKSDSAHEMNDVLQHRLEELKFRHYSYTHPVDFDPVPLGTEINTPDSEYLPAFNANGSVMVYTKRKSSEFLSNPSTRGQQEDLYISYIDNDNNFSKGIPLEELNTRLNEGAHSFSQDGKILIFTACDRPQSFGGCDLYISFKKNNNWSEPQNMGDVINTRHWESQPCLSADNKTLYFSSTRSGGYGKADIWKVNLENGKWSDAVNLGPLINTKGNEESPFIHPDNETIYFRSDHHIGLGDFDLFLSRLSNDEWTIPVNLGYPINSKGSEGALYVDLNGQKAYYATDKFTEQKNLDILYFKLPEQLRPQKVSYMTLRVRESDSFLPLAAKVELIDLQGIRENKLYKTDQKGELLTVLNTGEYALNVSMPGFLFHSENILIDEQKTIQKPFVFDIVLHRIKKSTIAQDNQPVTLENIFFESGSDKLLSKSNVELKILEDLLKTNPAINIQIIGHTDNVGSSDDNMLLSENRAKAIYNALISRGISNSRLLYIGMGETQPIDNNDTELGRQNNRRTEFIIIN